jgi:hypothetical protein
MIVDSGYLGLGSVGGSSVASSSVSTVVVQYNTGAVGGYSPSHQTWTLGYL